MKQNHIIQNVFIEITVDKKEKAFKIKDDINSFLTMDVFPMLEKYFDALNYKFPNQILQIFRLELDLDEKDISLTTDLKERIVELLKKELTEAIKPILKSDHATKFLKLDYDIETDSKINLLDNQEKLLQTFIHFIEKGYMPWWNSDKDGIDILQKEVFNSIISAKNFQVSIAFAIQKKQVQERIINQFSNAQIKQICSAILKNKDLKINLETNIVKQLSKLNFTDRNIIWSLVLSVIAKYLSQSNKDIEEYILNQIVKIGPLLKTTNEINDNDQNREEVIKIFPSIQEKIAVASAEKKAIKYPYDIKDVSIELVNEESNNTEKEANENNGHYVQNAGLVLIYPFVKNLFNYCNLIDTDTQKLSNPELCAHLLHYIATGKTNQAESNMIFEKFMCNIPLDHSISRHIKLSHLHKTQAKHVIEAVQQNWSPMKKSSIELLQNEFFQRSGKLVINDYDYILTVERKAQDILLDKLSWGIGLLKLPWQEKFIHVNW